MLHPLVFCTAMSVLCELLLVSRTWSEVSLHLFVGRHLCFGYPALVELSSSAFSSLYLYLASLLTTWATCISSIGYITWQASLLHYSKDVKWWKAWAFAWLLCVIINGKALRGSHTSLGLRTPLLDSKDSCLLMLPVLELQWGLWQNIVEARSERLYPTAPGSLATVKIRRLGLLDDSLVLSASLATTFWPFWS